MADYENKTTQVELFATLMYPRVFEFNRDMTGYLGAYEDCNGACTVNLLLDDENLDKLHEAGSQKQPKRDNKGNPIKDEKGRYTIKLDRKWEAPYTYGGAPQVARKDGTLWDVEVDGVIGNGSTALVFASVYPTRSGNGTRLDAIQVIDHVEYEGGTGIPTTPRFRDLTADEKKASPKKSSAKQELPEDEIPF